MPTKTEVLLRNLLENEEYNYNMAKRHLSEIEDLVDNEDKEDILCDALRIYMKDCLQVIEDLRRKLERYEKCKCSKSKRGI